MAPRFSYSKLLVPLAHTLRWSKTMHCYNCNTNGLTSDTESINCENCDYELPHIN